MQIALKRCILTVVCGSHFQNASYWVRERMLMFRKMIDTMCRYRDSCFHEAWPTNSLCC